MAKRKHTAKRRTTHRRRHSVGAINKSAIMEAGATIAGYVVGDMVSNKVLPTMDDKIKGAAQIAVGILVVPMVSKSPIAKSFGIGFATSGGVRVLKNMGVIAGSSRTMMLPYNAQKQIAGNGINQMVGGNGINQMVGARKKYAGRYGF